MDEEITTQLHQRFAYIPQFTPRSIAALLAAFLILALFYVIPTPEGLTFEGKMMLGILIVGAILWILEPIPLAITGLLIMILQPLLGVMDATEVFSSFGNQAVFFLIGAFILATGLEKYGIHRRIALRFLRFFGKNARSLTFGIMVSCAFLSFIMPSHGVAAFLLPIATTILIASKVVPRQSNFGKVSMLSVAYGCSIGSLGTLIGGARNPLTIEILAELDPPIYVSFFEWMIYAMPVVFISLPVVWFILQLVFPIEPVDITKARDTIDAQVQEVGRLSHQGIIVSIIFLFTITLWVFFSNIIGLAVIALVGSILLFITRSISWKDVEQSLPWGIILLYGGAVTLGVSMSETGAGAWIAQQVIGTVGGEVLLALFMLILLSVLLTNTMSNIGAVAILLPIAFGIATEIPGLTPLLGAMIVALSGGLAFMLVIATPGNAIAYSSGYYSTRDLLKAGSLANILCIFILFAVAWFYWQGVLQL